ncbi:MAG: tetratricopeptide repeat protein [Paludibacteraceae bacterium]
MFRALFVIAVAVLCMSCRPWQQAEQVLHTADSLDAQGVIYHDTAAFQSVIRTYDRPVVRCLKHSDLGKAYYYLGRNYEDYHQRYLSAAKCYTRSDQCRMSDPIMRGRVISCMENLCALQNNFPLATIYTERALKEFEHTDNKWYFANCLLYLSSLEQIQGNFEKADSLWHLSNQYNIDSAFTARLHIQRGYYFYRLHDLDSAIHHYKQVNRESLPNADKSFVALQLMRYYLDIDSIELAVENAKLVIAYSHNYLDCCNAYYTLMHYAEQVNDIEKLAEYSHNRADLYRLRINQTKDLEEAMVLLENHVESISTINKKKVIGVVVCLLMTLLLICIAVYIIRQKKKVQTLYTAQEESTHQHHIKTIEKLEKQLDIYAEYMEQHDEVWTGDAAFLNTTNLYLWNMADTMRVSYHLSVQDIKICVMTLLNMSRKEMATRLSRSESSIPKLRTNTAKKMGITATNLRSFLIEFLAS